MNLTRALTEGVGSWLHFELTCNRSGLFSEKYLTVPIGQILSAWSGNRVIAEYQHPVLAPRTTGRGRRPEIDFAVIKQQGGVSFAVESKWVGKTTPSARKILWDLIRLEMISHAEGAECFFILGGQRKALELLFDSDDFHGPQGPHPFKPILRTNINAMHTVTLLPTVIPRIPMLRSLFADYQAMPLPHSIVTRRSAPFPSVVTSSQFQVYAWKVSSAAPRDSFRPENIAHYRERYNEM